MGERHECKYGCNPNTFKILGNTGFYACPLHGGVDKKVQQYSELLATGRAFTAYSIPDEYLLDLKTYNANVKFDTFCSKSGDVETALQKRIEGLQHSKDVPRGIDIVYTDGVDAYKWAYNLLQIGVLEGFRTTPIKTVGWLNEIRSYRGASGDDFEYLDYLKSDVCILKVNRSMSRQNIDFLLDFITDRFFSNKGVVLLIDTAKEGLIESRNGLQVVFDEESVFHRRVEYIGIGKAATKVKSAVAKSPVLRPQKAKLKPVSSMSIVKK